MLDSLITASLIQDDLTFLERFPRLLLGDVEKKALGWIVAYSRKFHHAPSEERFRGTEFGIYLTRHLTTSPLADLFERAVAHKQKEFFLSKFHELEALMDSGEDLPLTTIVQLGRDLASVNVEEDDSVFSMDRDDMYSEDMPGGLLFGYDVLDTATGGLQPGEYGLLVARTGVGKTLIVCKLALKWAREGKKVLIISCEMPARQIVARLDAMMARFNSRLLRSKDNPALLRVKRREVEAELKEIKALGGDIIFPKSRSITTSKLRGLIADRRPDAVIVDGIYLLRSDDLVGASSDWQRLKAASNELKQICLEENLPIFGTSQLKRTGKEDGFSLEDIAYSDALGQDTDLVLVANKFAGVANQMTIELLKNRHGESYGGTVLKIDWETSGIDEVSWTDAIKSDEPEIKVMGKPLVVPKEWGDEDMAEVPGTGDDDDLSE